MSDWFPNASRQSASLLREWLAGRLTDSAKTWLEEKCQVHDDDQAFYLAFALAPRKLGKADLSLGEAELAAANSCREGWQPRFWSVDSSGSHPAHPNGVC